jgi:hypothetical protein
MRMGESSSSEASEYTYKTTRLDNTEDLNLVKIRSIQNKYNLEAEIFRYYDTKAQIIKLWHV